MLTSIVQQAPGLPTRISQRSQLCGSQDGQRAIALKYFENNKNFSKFPEISEIFEILGQETS